MPPVIGRAPRGRRVARLLPLVAAAAALVLVAGSVGVPMALLSASAPANAASVAHSRAASPRPAHPRQGGSRPDEPRHGSGRGALDRCDRHDGC